MQTNLRNRWLRPRTVLESSRVNGLISDAYLSSTGRAGAPFGVCAAMRSLDEPLLSLVVVFPDGRQAHADIQWPDGEVVLVEHGIADADPRHVPLPEEGHLGFSADNRVVLADSSDPKRTISFSRAEDRLDLPYMSLPALQEVFTDLDARHDELMADFGSWLRAHRGDARIGVLLNLLSQLRDQWQSGGGSPQQYASLIDDVCAQLNWLRDGSIRSSRLADPPPCSHRRVVGAWFELESCLWQPGNWCNYDEEFVQRGRSRGADFVWIVNGVQRRLGRDADDLNDSDAPICLVSS